MIIILVFSLCCLASLGVWGLSEAPQLVSESNDVWESNSVILLNFELKTPLDHNNCTNVVFYSEMGDCEIVCKNGTLHVTGDVNVLVNMNYDYLVYKDVDRHTNPVIFEKEN